MKGFCLICLSLLASVFVGAQNSPQLITEEATYYIITYYQVNGIKDGKYTETYIQTKEIKTDGLYEKGLKEGVWKYFDISGSISKAESYRKDKLNGTLTTYLQNKIWATDTYLNGEKNGISQKFTPDGLLEEKSTYRNNVLLSRYTYYPSGKIRSEEIISSEKNKIYFHKQYYESGAKQIISTMKNRECIKSVSYHKNGRVESISEIVDGQLKMTKKYDSDGNELSVGCGC
jgi:antitoxin component YwqK of YwqJK toxin-antitoxin module